MKKRMTTREYIEKSGLKVIRDNSQTGITTTWIVEKDGREFEIWLTNNFTNFEDYFGVAVKQEDGSWKTLGTRCLLATAIRKIKQF